MTWTSIFLRTLCGETIQIDSSHFQPDATVRDLKNLVEASHGLQARYQRLIYCGKVLHDEDLVASHKFQDGTLVHLVTHTTPRAGGLSSTDPLPKSAGHTDLPKAAGHTDLQNAADCIGLPNAEDRIGPPNAADCSAGRARVEPVGPANLSFEPSKEAREPGSDRIAFAVWALETALWITSTAAAQSTAGMGGPPALTESHVPADGAVYALAVQVAKCSARAVDCAIKSTWSAAEVVDHASEDVAVSADRVSRVAEGAIESALRAAGCAVETAAHAVASAFGAAP